MKLYASPWACSMAPHLVLREAAIPHELCWLSLSTKRLQSGESYVELNPKGKVAALVLEDGSLLTENLAILSQLAELSPALAPSTPAERLRSLEWLSFIATELHKQILSMFFDPFVPKEMKAFVVERLPRVLRFPERALAQSPFLLGERFSVADAYLFWGLTLLSQLPFSLEEHPALRDYRKRIASRSAVQEVLALEKQAYALLQERPV